MATNGRSRRLPTSGVYAPAGGSNAGGVNGVAPTTAAATRPMMESANSGLASNMAVATGTPAPTWPTTETGNSGATGQWGHALNTDIAKGTTTNTDANAGSGLRHYSVIAEEDAGVPLFQLPAGVETPSSFGNSRFTPLPSTTDRYDEYIPPPTSKPSPFIQHVPTALARVGPSSNGVEASATPRQDTPTGERGSAGAAMVPLSEEIYVKSEHVGSVIGKLGANIKKIMDATGTMLSFIGDKKAEDGRVPLLIRAPTSEQFEQAKAQVAEIINQRELLAARYGNSTNPAQLPQLSAPTPVKSATPAGRTRSPTGNWQKEYAQRVSTSALQMPLNKLQPAAGREESAGYESPRPLHDQLDMVVEGVDVLRGLIADAGLDKIREEFGVKLKRTVGSDTHEHFIINGRSDRVQLARAALERSVAESDYYEEKDVEYPPPSTASLPPSAEMPRRAVSVQSGLPQQLQPPRADGHVPVAVFMNTMKAMQDAYEKHVAELTAANLALQQKLDSLQGERR